MSPIKTNIAMTDLTVFLAAQVRATGLSQTELSHRTGFSQKHISEMMCIGAGSTGAWDRLLRAAGCALPQAIDTGEAAKR